MFTDRLALLVRTCVVAAAAALLACATPASARQRPVPCAGGRYLLQGDPLLAGTSAPVVDALAVSASQVALGNACAPVAPRQLRGTKKGITTIRVVWLSCVGFTGRVKLTGKIVNGCARLLGTVKARRFKKTIQGLRSACGDGHVDAPAGEQCEPPGTAACDADCRAIPPVSTTTTLPTHLDVWQPTTMPWDPDCHTGCTEIAVTAPLAHSQAELHFRVNPGIDDPVAQWGDCLESILVCFEHVPTAITPCIDGAACPAACKALFHSRAAGATDESTRLAIFDAVFVDPTAPCRPAGEVTP